VLGVLLEPFSPQIINAGQYRERHFLSMTQIRTEANQLPQRKAVDAAPSFNHMQ